MIRRLLLVAGLAMASFLTSGSAEEARVAVYAVNEKTSSLSPAAPDLSPAEGQKIIASAKGPEGSTLVVVPFFVESPWIRISPLLEEQDSTDEPRAFPQGGGNEGIPFGPGDPAFDLYVAIFPKGSPQLAAIAENVTGLKKSLAAGNTEVVELHALQLRRHLSDAVRKSSGTTASGGFGDLDLTIREAPAGKAAVSRTGTGKEVDSGKSASETGETKTFADLAEAWKQASVNLPMGLVSPGAKVFSFSSQSAP